MPKHDLLTQLIEPARANVLRLLALHDAERFSLGEIARRAGISSPTASKELRKLVAAGVVEKIRAEGRGKKETRYGWNERGPHAATLSTFIHEVSPERFDDVEKTLKGIGRIALAVLSGVFVGDSNRPADLILVSDFLNESKLEKAIKTLERKYGREMRYAVFSTPEFRYRLTIKDKLVRGTLDYPHRVLLNKGNLL